MGFTVRLMLGTILVLLCSWSIETAHLHPIQQAKHDKETNDKLQKTETENVTRSIIVNFDEDSTKPKTDFSTEVNTSLDKENNVVDKVEAYKEKRAEIAKSLDIEKYVSEDFHNKNNVYTVSTSPDTKKFLDPDFAYHVTTRKFVDYSREFDYHAELTTPKTLFFDAKFKKTQESLDQKIEEHNVDLHEMLSESESKENLSLDELYEETKKNDTKTDLSFTNFKNIISNDTEGINSLHKDLMVEGGTNLQFRSSFNHTMVIDDDSGNNTISKEPGEKKVETSTLLNVVLDKGDSKSAESSTVKNVVITTRKSITLTKPPSSKNSSHISILSNNIETETMKAISPLHLDLKATKGKSKEETQSVSEVFLQRASLGVAKRPYYDVQPSESTIDTNHIHRKHEQLQQENQIVPIHVQPPVHMKNRNQPTQIPLGIIRNRTSPESAIPTKTNETRTTELSSQDDASVEISSESVIHINETEQPSLLSDNIKPIKQKEGQPEVDRSDETLSESFTAKSRFQKSSETEDQTTESTLKEETTGKDNVYNSITTENLSAEKPEPISPLEDVSTIAFKLSVAKITSPKPETTTEFQTERTTRFLEIIATTICPPKLAITSAKPKRTTNSLKETEFETVTSIITETSVSPWLIATNETSEIEGKTISPSEYAIELTTANIEMDTNGPEPEVTTLGTLYLSDSTTATEATTENPTTIVEETSTAATTETPFNINSDGLKNAPITTENSVRTSKAMIYKTNHISEATVEKATTVDIETTEQVKIDYETPQSKTEQLETTTTVVPRLLPEVKSISSTEFPVKTETTVDNNSITSEFYEHTDPPKDNSGTIAAIIISSIGAVCLILLAGLLIIMRKRQKRFNYGQRCRPVSLDDYSMDNVSVYNNSVRRKGMLRGSKRSYGNPAFEDPALVSHPLNFPALGKFAGNLEDIIAEFEEIPQITARTTELPEGCDTKNRYANVIPLPESRVFLNLIDGYPNSDYINANYVSGPKNTKGYYIACQAPMQNTVDDFWRMIWEQQSKVIMMLTHLFENGVEKCIDYLPPSEVLDCHRLFGDFQVTLKKREVKDKYIISNLQLKNMVSNSWREVTHFWYLGWPEKGVPSEANSLIAFLIEARSYMKSSSLDRKDITNENLVNGVAQAQNELNPVVVHCSPGTGRTGVVIACDIAIREFEKTRLVDVPKIVYKIRRDRASAVSTKDQYTFIYKVINLYAAKLTGGALDSL